MQIPSKKFCGPRWGDDASRRARHEWNFATKIVFHWFKYTLLDFQILCSRFMLRLTRLAGLQYYKETRGTLKESVGASNTSRIG